MTKEESNQNKERDTLPELGDDSEVQDVISPSPMDAYWEQVNYQYVSYAQIVASPTDFRILLGERLPPNGKVKPTMGIVMPHAEAKAIHKALGAQLQKIEEVMKRKLAQQNEAIVGSGDSPGQ
jgi:hypothetical protein